MPMTDEEKIRFTEDLASIYSDIRGKTVKDSIWDALEILGRYAGTASGGGGPAILKFTYHPIYSLFGNATFTEVN